MFGACLPSATLPSPAPVLLRGLADPHLPEALAPPKVGLPPAMAAEVKDWGTKPRKSSMFVADENPAYGMDLGSTKREFRKRASVVGAKAITMSKKTAKVSGL